MKEYKFKAKIEATLSGGAYVRFPYDTQAEFGTKGQVRVDATFDGVPYAGSLAKCGPSEHMLGILKDIRKQIGKGPGDTVDVILRRDESIRTVEVPPEFAAAMKKKGVLAAFEKLSYTHRKEYFRWIIEAKKEETRQHRIARAIEMLKTGVKTPG